MVGYVPLGFAFGALVGSALPLDTAGLEFVLTALFVVLAIEQAFAVRDPRPFVVALGCGLLALMLVGGGQMLIAALGLTTVLLSVDGRRRMA
jgi:4-azaleucine resistance transporter AzlC